MCSCQLQVSRFFNDIWTINGECSNSPFFFSFKMSSFLSLMLTPMLGVSQEQDERRVENQTAVVSHDSRIVYRRRIINSKMQSSAITCKCTRHVQYIIFCKLQMQINPPIGALRQRSRNCNTLRVPRQQQMDSVHSIALTNHDVQV